MILTVDFYLEVVFKRSCHATIASHSPLNVSDTVKNRGLVPKDHQQEMAHASRIITWPMTSR